MRARMLSFAFGIAIVAQLERLPSHRALLQIGLAVVCLGMASYFLRRNSVLDAFRQHFLMPTLFALLGFVYSCIFGYHILQNILQPELEQQSLLVQGRIDGLVESRASDFIKADQKSAVDLHFQFDIEAAQIETHTNAAEKFPEKILLNWYGADKLPQPGERWQLRVHLKRPHGFANPGGFDYAAWLIANRIGATGRIENASENLKMAAAEWYSVDAWRGRVQSYLNNRLQNSLHRSLLLGLLIGDGSAISAAEWDVFRATGTVHVFVVSGLQIAFTGGLAMWFAQLWWRSPWCNSRRRNYLIGVMPGLIIAFAYSGLAGWGIPIQRALIMFIALLLTLVVRIQFRVSTGWIAAFCLVLIADPLAVRDIGFWFSFITVATILLSVCAQRDAITAQSGWQKYFPTLLRQWSRVQVALFIASLPLLLWLSGQVTLLALPANCVAIPLSTLVSLPLAFLGLVGDLLSLKFGAIFWQLSDNSLEWLWRYLQWLQLHGNAAIWHPLGIQIFTCALIAIAALLVLMPRGVSGKWLVPIFFLPLVFPALTFMPTGSARITVVDVGQGLSVLIETSAHHLLYDTGPPFGPERTVADMAILPLLRTRGVEALDAVVVSHNDNDHAAGWPAIAREFSVGRLLIGEPIANAAEFNAEYCHDGMHWRWDGVDFDVLYPSSEISANTQLAGNNRSCVVQISVGEQRILLTGDIEKIAERNLLTRNALSPVSILLAPHHGSRTSSTQAFIEKLQPAYVVFSSGYFNRFRHPNQEVVARYRDANATLLNTATTGAITFTVGQDGVEQIAEQRAQMRHYWD